MLKPRRIRRIKQFSRNWVKKRISAKKQLTEKQLERIHSRLLKKVSLCAKRYKLLGNLEDDWFWHKPKPTSFELRNMKKLIARNLGQLEKLREEYLKYSKIGLSYHDAMQENPQRNLERKISSTIARFEYLEEFLQKY